MRTARPYTCLSKKYDLVCDLKRAIHRLPVYHREARQRHRGHLKDRAFQFTLTSLCEGRPTPEKWGSVPCRAPPDTAHSQKKGRGALQRELENPDLKDMHEEIMITLLLVDDDPLVLQGLRLWFERTPDITVVGEASNGSEAIALAQALHPNVVLLDISMPSRDGIAATAALRASAPQSP